VKTLDAEGARPRPGSKDEAARKRAAVEIYARNETTLRRAAQRYSLCVDDAEDALQRGLEILLCKAPTDDPRQLLKWMQTVIRHESLAIRRERERTLADPDAQAKPDREDWVSLLPTAADGPPERAERQEAVGRWREALRALKPQELRALTLLAEGYSYAEIGEITGYSQTKINRCLAEGRERFRALVAGSEDGTRCAEMRPLLSAFCDGEAKGEALAMLREHLRACAGCRATLRTYRTAPAAAVVLLPSIPLPRSLWERAQDAFGDLFGRFGGSGGTVSQASAGGGAGGVAAVAKIAVVCVGAAGGAAACVAGGLVPAPLDLGPERERPRIERQLSEIPTPDTPEPRVEYAPAPAPEPKPKPQSSPEPTGPSEVEPATAEPVPAENREEATEYVPAPEPVAEPAPASSSGAGSPAGEFGP
jgi:RNA polymerase sigma factor (sigma-70 family)